jgi:hypothetical protein
MGSYRSEDEALIGLARQLTDAYGEASRREDQDFACDAIADFLHEYRLEAPSKALLAVLDLPLTAETYPLVDEAQTLLAGRGPAVVRLLLEAALGEVYDPDGPASERAAETLDQMDRRDSVQGLVEVLCGRAGDDVKGAAVDRLVALGPFAEPRLAAVLDDERGGEWARAAIEQVRYERAHPEPLEEYAAGEDEVPDDAGELFEVDAARHDETVVADVDGHAEEDRAGGLEDAGPPGGLGSEDDVLDDAGREAVEDGEGGGPGPRTGGRPDQQHGDEASDEFLRRFQQESGGDPTPS